MENLMSGELFGDDRVRRQARSLDASQWLEKHGRVDRLLSDGASDLETCSSVPMHSEAER